MARLSTTTAAIAALLLVSATPLASADNYVMTQDEQAVPTSPAQTVNMIPLNLCGEREAVVAELAQVFQEQPMAIGQVDDRAVVEIFVSDSGTWTILATGTDGLSCIVSAGENFESTSIVRGVDA